MEYAGLVFEKAEDPRQVGVYLERFPVLGVGECVKAISLPLVMEFLRCRVGVMGEDGISEEAQSCRVRDS